MMDLIANIRDSARRTESEEAGLRLEEVANILEDRRHAIETDIDYENSSPELFEEYVANTGLDHKSPAVIAQTAYIQGMKRVLELLNSTA